jgi:hypothetical protein
VKYCPTEEMLADIFTKGLKRETFEYLRTKIGVMTKEQALEHNPSWGVGKEQICSSVARLESGLGLSKEQRFAPLRDTAVLGNQPWLSDNDMIQTISYNNGMRSQQTKDLL